MFFLFYRSVGFEENIKYGNNSCNALTCSFHFHYVTSKIMLTSTLQNYFPQKRQSLIYLEFCEYFLWFWAKEVNCLAV